MDINGRVFGVLIVCSLRFLLVLSHEIGDLRLVDGPTPNAGRVEFYLGFRGWYSTCDVSWGIDDAIVVCRQLGFPGAALARAHSSYGSGSGVPLAREWHCQGDESKLQECQFVPTPRCQEAVGVVCQAPGYLGCYADSGRPLTSVLGDSFLALEHMSVSACREHCRATGARLAGLKHGRECYCSGSERALVPDSRQSDRQCQEPCAGNPDQVCGGPRARLRSHRPDRLSVYDLTLGQCDVPTEPTNGISLGGQFAYGDVIRFECRTGYRMANLSAPAAVRCVMVADGTGKTVNWNSSVPHCQAALENDPWIAQEEQLRQYGSRDRQYVFVAILACIAITLLSAIIFILVKRKMASHREVDVEQDPPPFYQDLIRDYERIADPKTGMYPPERTSYYQSLKPVLPGRPSQLSVRVNIPGHPSYPEEVWRY